MKRGGVVISVRLKILTVVLGFFALIAFSFLLYSSVTTMHYRELRMDAVSMLVELESEKIGRSITDMERSAVNFAMLGEQVLRSQRAPGEMGRYVSVEEFANFRVSLVGVGGGIWYEPYALREDTLRAGFYAYLDSETGLTRSDPEFMSEEYDYHSRMWYQQIRAGVERRYQTVWTSPYYEFIGTNSLLTTVGAGIFDEYGIFVGMATADWQIQSLIDRLSAIKPTENSFVLLASPAYDYVIVKTRTEQEFTGSLLSGLAWYDELRLSDDGAMQTGRFSIEGVEYISISRMLENGWVFSMQVPANEIFSAVESRNTFYSLLIGILSLVLLVLAFLLISFFVNRPIKKLSLGVAELGGGDLDRKIDIKSKDEIGMLAAVFNKMTVDLKESIEQNALERAEKERIVTELEVAATIQASMLPCTFPAFPKRTEFELYASMEPAKEVGGDFYDFFMIDADTLAVVIADVSGKGVPAALFMVVAKILIKNNSQYGKTPKEVFDTVNSLLCENNEADMFVTAFLGFLDIPTGKFTYVNAGHEPPFLKRAGGEFEKLRVNPNLMLAAMDGMVYRQEETVLRRGDMLLLYTDGVTEAVNPGYELFTAARLQISVNKYGSSDVTELITEIRAEIDRFANGAEQADDITMLTLRINDI